MIISQIYSHHQYLPSESIHMLAPSPSANEFSPPAPHPAGILEMARLGPSSPEADITVTLLVRGSDIMRLLP